MLRSSGSWEQEEESEESVAASDDDQGSDEGDGYNDSDDRINASTDHANSQYLHVEDDDIGSSIPLLKNFPQDEFPELYKVSACRQSRMKEKSRRSSAFPLSKLPACLLSMVISSGIDKQSLLEVRRTAPLDDS
ncbi:hypothetical protein HDU76_013978 [Blyttiomyces sp. JEL0837]|nr:hypothetical protein HDU76_013978 [Blyttiomyces sp. JEL0837]